MTREEQIEQKAKELGQKYFPNENNIWARPNYEAQCVEFACKEMMEWADAHPNEGLVSIDKVCEYLTNHIDKDLVIYNNNTWLKRDEFIEKLKKEINK